MVLLNSICDECYEIFKEFDFYTACRQDCYRNNFFEFCMNVTGVDEETAETALDVLGGINGGNIFGIDFQS